ncbi:sigma-70 family RNA polymerase sigma factor [Sphingomonas sp. AP4-R1]|uniref:RNA polymerase sigma factor n=1 Tax=Sphingomonas sp. AP4-R1 TaxID=2735134 RepID=UPI001493B7E0|nr:sigma-70 family RNA polymerase sigma factor [Sphingomonas sp. AP4-R1]QJU59874.1 sigma-70 family RNA polymerase sigma factor [Sphingomonas sp. AP4-R1]
MSWLRPIDAWFAEAILPHEPVLLQQARRWTGVDEDARDLVHEVYTQILQLDAWEQIANPAAYAARMMRNNALQRLRRARIVPFRQLTALENERADPAPGSFQICAGREELARLRAAIDRLPPACRRVILLRKFEDCPPRMIAERLGISLSTVEKHLARGLMLLAQARDIDAIATPAEMDEAATPESAPRQSLSHI